MIGAALAPLWLPNRLGWALAAFALALGIGAHALDELRGRPLATRIPDGVLWLLAAALAGAVGIGIAAAIAWWPWLLAFVAFGGFIVVAYNLELFGASSIRISGSPSPGSVPAAHCLCRRSRDDHPRRRRRRDVRGAAEPRPATAFDACPAGEKARPQHVGLARARRRRDRGRHAGAADARLGEALRISRGPSSCSPSPSSCCA